jgi:pyridinium-3,5-bisthiocarboxylic acid mononucleotide nickel chelatase
LRALVFDPFSGISGDMTLGALLDLGLPEEWLRGLRRPAGARADRGLGRAGAAAGIACTPGARLPHEHAHRHLRDVVRIIDGAGVHPEVRDRAVHAFTLLAEAEAEVHGTTPERVHFHEVGALDAIVDILGAMAGCASSASRPSTRDRSPSGAGGREMEHGRFPVPPPAVLKLLEGIPTRDPAYEGECTTPTGAAILKALTGGGAAGDASCPCASGFGAGRGTRRIGRTACGSSRSTIRRRGAEELFVVQADLDDMEPEYLPRWWRRCSRRAPTTVSSCRCR